MGIRNDNANSNMWTLVDIFLDVVLNKILHLKIEDKKREGLAQFVRFGIVGLSNTIISYVIYVIMLAIFQMKNSFPQWDYLIAQIVAFILSVLWSFYWNNKYVFRLNSKSVFKIIEALVKTYISYAFTGLILNSFLSLIWVDVLQINKLLAPIINLLISVPVNFLLNKFWAFKKQ